MTDRPRIRLPRWCRRCGRPETRIRIEPGRLLCVECLLAERALNSYWRRRGMAA